MEPLEQNLALFSFLSYIVTKLDKIIEKSCVLKKQSQWSKSIISITVCINSSM